MAAVRYISTAIGASSGFFRLQKEATPFKQFMAWDAGARGSNVRNFSASKHATNPNRTRLGIKRYLKSLENKGKPFKPSENPIQALPSVYSAESEWSLEAQGLNTGRERTKQYMHPSASSNPCDRKSTPLKPGNPQSMGIFLSGKSHQVPKKPESDSDRCCLQSGLNSPFRARHHSAKLLQPRLGVFGKSQRPISWSKINSATLSLFRCFELNT